MFPRALVVASHDITRAGLRSLLEHQAGIHVVGEAASAASAIALCSAEQPELILLELELPDLRGVAIIGALRRASPESAVIALSAAHESEAVIAAIQAGATAYLLKDSPAGALRAAVERVLAGEAFIDRALAGQVIRAFASGSAQPAALPRPDPLTPRECEVLRSIAHGRSNKEIAFDLEVAVGTVKIHVERILRKLSVSNRAEATMQAVRLGIVDPEEERSRPVSAGTSFPS